MPKEGIGEGEGSDAFIVEWRGQDVNLWKSGARFSLKAATPSFDSAVS
jgi:hypothetical protein